MATTANETMKVQELTKYGFKSNGAYINWSKNCKDQGKVVPGGEYEFSVYTADSGKKYVNSVVKTIGQAAPAVKAPAPKVAAPTAKPVVAAKSNDMSKDEWAAKDRRISRQGCIQVAVQVAGTFEQAAELADKMLGYVNG